MARIFQGIALALLTPFGCAQILEIEQATVDPSLLEANTVGSSGAGASSHEHSGTAAQGGGPTSGGPNAGGRGDAQEPPPGGESGTGGSGDPIRTLCDQYCETIGKYCTGDQLQYRDSEQCLAVCSLLPEGAVDESDGNTVACRARYAAKARYAAGTELAAYCRQAGPGGDDRCGGNCEGFCSIMMPTCAPNTADHHFESAQACQLACSRLQQIPYTYGHASVADSNTVQCRLFHASSAVMLDPEEHCEHAMGFTLCEAPEL